MKKIFFESVCTWTGYPSFSSLSWGSK